MSRKLIGELLIEEGVITREQLEAALQEQQTHGGRIGELLIDHGYVSEEALTDALGRQLGIPALDVRTADIDLNAVRLIHELVARRYKVIPVAVDGDLLTLVMVDPLNTKATDEVQRITGFRVKPMVCTERSIVRAIERYYSMKEARASEPGPDTAGVQPAVRLMDEILRTAVTSGATRVHIEPDAGELRVRMRIDGELREMLKPPMTQFDALSSRLKIMARLNTGERWQPQDGRFTVSVDHIPMNVGISTLPTLNGERIVLSLSAPKDDILALENLGFSESGLAAYADMLSRSRGLIIVAAPPHSGRTTALYAGLTRRAAKERNVVSLEKPVSYDLLHVYQVPLSPESGLDYAEGLRSALLQDADLIMIDEVPDTRVARSLIHAAMTGHLILAGLTAYDSGDALLKLMELGVDSRLLGSCLLGIISPRVIRQICPECRVETPAGDLPSSWADSLPDRLAEGEGCRACRESGYSGRTGLYEVRTCDEEIRHALLSGSYATLCSVNGRSRGLVSEGLEKIRRGISTVDEVLRVTEQVNGP